MNASCSCWLHNMKAWVWSQFSLCGMLDLGWSEPLRQVFLITVIFSIIHQFSILCISFMYYWCCVPVLFKWWYVDGCLWYTKKFRNFCPIINFRNVKCSIKIILNILKCKEKRKVYVRIQLYGSNVNTDFLLSSNCNRWSNTVTCLKMSDNLPDQRNWVP
jgi:hypothetical protein